MSITLGRTKVSTDIANVLQPIALLRPQYDAAGNLTVFTVKGAAVFGDGSIETVGLDILPLLTLAQRTTLTNVLASIGQLLRTSLR